MSKWQRSIYLQPEWSKAREREIPVQQLAAKVAKTLRALRPLHDEYLEERRIELAEEFEWVSTQPEADFEEFDCWMQELYDWGDTSLDDSWNGKKVCWIDTISKMPAEPA